MKLILIVKALAATSISVPLSASLSKVFKGTFYLTFCYARYAPECFHIFSSIQYSILYCNYVHTILQIIITDEDNNENSNE